MRQAAIAVLVLAMATATQAKEIVTVSELTPFAEDSGATEAVMEECKMEERLPKYLQSEAKKHTKIEFTEEPLESVDGKVLHLEFTNVFGLGGGGYSGSKSAIVEGELKENGEVIASVTARRRSLISMGFGTCSLMKKITKALGEDIADWLESPTMDARLGDLEDADED